MTCTASWNSAGVQSVAFSPTGTIFTSSFTAGLVIQYAADGTILSSWTQPHGPRGPFWPYGIDVDAQGEVYVSDFSNHCLDKFSPEGELLATIGGDILVAPSGVTCNRPTGHVFVCDGHGYSIREFSPTGELVRSIAADWYISDLTFGNSGDLYVSAYNGRVYRYAADGTLVATWQPPNSGSVIFTSIARSPDDRIHVVDQAHNRVVVLTSELQEIGEWSLDCAALDFSCHDSEGYLEGTLTGVDFNGEGTAILSNRCKYCQVAVFPEVTVGTKRTTWGALKALYRR
jgi:sugar lactone lactonase YvrE